VGGEDTLGHEAAWPVRVDTFLDGVAEDRVDRWVQSACVLCSNGCGLDIAVADGRMVGVRGRPGDRVNRGRLGPKGLFG
jgi:ferredoxin-nitrate reductase